MHFERVIVLGSGTIVPVVGHGCSGYLLQGGGQKVLIDCGAGTLYRLAELGVSPTEIELLIITHFHLDHVSDLAAILNSRWLQAGKKTSTMEIIGPVGTRDYLSWLGTGMGNWFDDYRITVHELRSGGGSLGGIEVRAEPTEHTGESIGYRLTDDTGQTLFYSGDTDFNEGLVPLARRADIALFECSMPDEKKLNGHLTPRLAARLARMAEVERLVLTHFYAEVTSVDIRARAAEEFAGEIILAKDGELIDFTVGPN